MSRRRSTTAPPRAGCTSAPRATSSPPARRSGTNSSAPTIFDARASPRSQPALIWRATPRVIAPRRAGCSDSTCNANISASSPHCEIGRAYLSARSLRAACTHSPPARIWCSSVMVRNGTMGSRKLGGNPQPLENRVRLVGNRDDVERWPRRFRRLRAAFLWRRRRVAENR